MGVEYNGFVPRKKDELYFEQKLNHYSDLLPWNSYFKIEFSKTESVFKATMMLHAVHEEYNFIYKAQKDNLRVLMDQLLEELHAQIDNWHNIRLTDERSS